MKKYSPKKEKYTEKPRKTETHIQPPTEKKKDYHSRLTTRMTSQHVKQRQMFNKSKHFSQIPRHIGADTKRMTNNTNNHFNN